MNRMIRDAINASATIEKLGDGAEVFYRRLLHEHDYFGRYEADPVLLRSRLYPLRSRMRISDVASYLSRCVQAGAIVVYPSAGKPYLVVAKVERPRAGVVRSKFPQPPRGIRCWRVGANGIDLTSEPTDEDNICAQLQTVSMSLSSSVSRKRGVRGEEPLLPFGESAGAARAPSAAERTRERLLKEFSHDSRASR